ncbi:hypothetical protein F4811DRAFT_550412 [Daldinia bambusicola]|nr:hypothetical protein F4811DRAFT_550412 [Daldinia bambusicola]
MLTTVGSRNDRQKPPIANYFSPSETTVIVRDPYLIRTAVLDGEVLQLIGDINNIIDVELIYEPTPTESLPPVQPLNTIIPDCLPKVQTSYDDSKWVNGSLIYRGNFTANGNKSSLVFNVTGGNDFSYSLWLNDEFGTSWDGATRNDPILLTLSSHHFLSAGKSFVLALLIDYMSQDEQAPRTPAVKALMSIINFALASRAKSGAAWKTTGNLGGESYRDLARGPRNEGDMFAERQGRIPPAGTADSGLEVAGSRRAGRAFRGGRILHGDGSRSTCR